MGGGVDNFSNCNDAIAERKRERKKERKKDRNRERKRERKIDVGWMGGWEGGRKRTSRFVLRESVPWGGW